MCLSGESVTLREIDSFLKMFLFDLHLMDFTLRERAEGKVPLRETLVMSQSTLQCDRLELSSPMINIRCVQLKSLYTAVMWILLESYKIHMSTLTFVWIEAHVFDQQCQCLIGS